MYNCLSCVVQQASFTPVSVGWWILCRSCHCLYSSQTCLALSGHGGRQGETKCMFMIALHQLFLFLVINRHCPCTCIFIRAAAGLVSLICQSSEMLQFDFTLLSFLPVFILAGVLCKLHAHHGQYLAPRKVRTTQEGLCFRDGLRAWSPPLWPCAKKTKRCIQCCWVFFFFADYYRWWCGSHLTVCTCCGRACSPHEEHLHCGVSQFLVFHAGRQQEGRGRENEQGTSYLCYLHSWAWAEPEKNCWRLWIKSRFKFNESSRTTSRVRESL